MISDVMASTLKAVREARAQDPKVNARTLIMEAEPDLSERHAVRRLERADAHGFIEWRDRISSAWLTPEGDAALKEYEEKKDGRSAEA